VVLRYLFDITTSAHWGGAAVGITRVEEGLARRARQYLGNDLTFCVYDKYRNLFLAVDDATATKFLDGKFQIKLAPPPQSSLAAVARRRVGEARSQLRRALLSNADLYHAVQRVRGRSFTREEIARIRHRELQKSGDEAALPAMEPIALDENTTVISGGLDWEHKDLRALWRLKQQYGFKYLPIVYDLIPIMFPHYLVPGYVELLTDYFGELYWLSDRVMCISEATRREWLHYCDKLAGKPVPADVFPLGCDLRPPPDDGPAPELPPELVGKRYALLVSTIEPRKNHRMLYDAWDDCVRQKLVDAERDRLVFVGRRGWAMDDFLREVSLNPATRDTIVVLNNVNDAQLELIYRNCAFVTFPSHYEGFGLPVAEALGHGKPCISSDAGALPEIGGDLVMRLGTKDTAGWTRAIAHYLTSPDELKGWSDRVKKEYRTITWDMAAQTFFTRVAEGAR
jgi:glycosyltransferase involved in cell wall biosynthesis